MQVHSFIAKSAADAVVQIRESLGPNAVVLHVRQLSELGRFWQQPRIEVLAHLPEETPAPPVEPAETLPRESPMDRRTDIYSSLGAANAPTGRSGSSNDRPGVNASEQATKLLLSSGLLPVAAQAVSDLIRYETSDNSPETLGETVGQIRAALSRLWKQPPPLLKGEKRPHVMVGPPGVGKTTCLCKWLAQKVLVEGVSSSVWKLDTSTANTAEFLDVYCEILGIQIGRAWPPVEDCPNEDLVFIDLPGVDWRNASALSNLARQLEGFPSPHLHLVLNAAYDSSLLLEQIRAFASFPIEDLIVTHLDEEIRWGKLWNLVLGTNYSIRFFSDGQNIPGNFHPAAAEKIFARQLPAK